MSNLHCSISQYTAWLPVLDALGSPTAGRILPAISSCPLCHTARLKVFPDDVLGGQWYHCTGCRFSGDTIELASLAWKLPIGLAISKLRRDNLLDLPPQFRVEEHIDGYIADHVERRKHLKEFWESCRHPEPIVENRGFEQLLKRFGINDSAMNSEDWRSRGGQFVGRTTRSAIDHFFQPQNTKTRETNSHVAGKYDVHGTANGMTVLRGRGWSDVLVVPYWDLPDRLRGFLFVGRGGEPADFVYKKLNSSAAINAVLVGTEQEDYRAGLAMWTAADHAESGHQLLVVHDVELACKLQVQHLRDHAEPLPIVASWQTTAGTDVRRRIKTSPLDYAAIAALSRRTLVHWSPADPVEAIAAARRSHGMVSTKCSRRPIERYLSRRHPNAVVPELCDTAVSWQAALEHQLDRKSCVESLEMIDTLDLPRGELIDFLGHLRDDIADPILKTLESRPRDVMVRVKNQAVCETAVGAWVDRMGEQITDAIPRIDTIVYRPTHDQYDYHGRILFRGREYPFQAPGVNFEADPLDWCRRYLLRRGHGVATIASQWEKYALTISQLFHAPRSVVAIDRVGWDADRALFAFPSYLQPGAAAAYASDLLYVSDPTHSPCQGFDLPERDYAATHELVETLDGDDLLWSIAAVVLATALAPVVHETAPILVLSGRIAETRGIEIACHLGCRRISKLDEVALRANTDDAMRSHAWAVAIEGRAAGSHDRFPMPAQPGMIIAAGRLGASRIAIESGAIVIDQGQVGEIAAISHAVDRLIPAYLADLATRRMLLSTQTGSLVERVATDLDHWRRRVCPELRHASIATRLKLNLVPVEAVARLVHDLADRGELQVVDAGVERKRPIPKNSIVIDGPVVTVSVPLLNRKLKHAGGEFIDLALAGLSLLEAPPGIFLGECHDDGLLHWTFDFTWWNDTWNRHRAARDHRLRVLS